MHRSHGHRPSRTSGAAWLPAVVALTLAVAACSSTSTPVATSSSTAGPVVSASVSAAPVSPVTVSSASVSAPVSPITQPSIPVSAPEPSAPDSSAESTESTESPTAGSPGTESSASSPAESSEPADTELPVATVNTTDASARAALAAMNAALLTAAQVGTGFTRSPDAPSDATQKLPCGSYSASALYPNALRTELIAARGDAVQFQESLYLYLDAETSAKAYQTELDGLDCTKGTISGTPVTIGKPQDVTASVGGTKAVAWEVTIDGATGVVIAVNSGSVFIGYTFLVATGTDPGTLPNPLAVAKKATAKVLAGGLG